MTSDDIKRLNFYERQYLGARDFQDEQEYHIEMRRRHLVAHHRWGIVAGLEIAQDASSKVWYVTPGLAVDGFGREVVVFDPEPLNTNAVAEQLAGEPSPALLKIWIAYQVEKAQRPPQNYRTCGNEEQFMRVRETFRLVYQNSPPFDLEKTQDPQLQNQDNPQTWPQSFQNLSDDPKTARWPIYLGTLTWGTDPDNPAQNLITKVDHTDPLDNRRRRYVGVVAEEIEAPDRRLLIRARGNESPLPDGAAGAAVMLEGRLEVVRQLTANANLNVQGKVGIGIGTDEPDTRLHVGGGTAASLQEHTGLAVFGKVDEKNLVLDVNTLAARDNKAAAELRLQPEGGDLSVHADDPDSTFVVKASGNVGIGTLTPSGKLEIAGGGNLLLSASEQKFDDPGDIVFQTFDGTQKARIWSSPQTGAALYLSSGNNSPDVAIDAAGKVGVKTTTPQRALEVNGGVHSSGGDAAFSFGDRDTNQFVSNPVNGERWVWYSKDGKARLWSGGDKVTVSPQGDVNVDGAVVAASVQVPKLGLGTTGPVARLHVRDEKSGSAGALSNHVAVIENTATTNDADVLALKLSTMDPGPSNNYISFMDGNGSIGSIERIPLPGGGVTFNSPGNDYAEWLPRLREKEEIEEGDIVGVFAGRVTRATEGAEQLMAISSRPIVLGNMPPAGAKHLYERVAFLGQVTVKVRGPVNAGDYIIASGLHDGTGRAVAPEHLMPEHLTQILGRAWESTEAEGVHKINTVVGLPSSHTSALAVGLVDALRRELNSVKAELETLKAARE